MNPREEDLFFKGVLENISYRGREWSSRDSLYLNITRSEQAYAMIGTLSPTVILRCYIPVEDRTRLCNQQSVSSSLNSSKKVAPESVGQALFSTMCASECDSSAHLAEK